MSWFHNNNIISAILQKQIPLVIIEAESEFHKCITTFWGLIVDKALEEYGKEKFNPFGLISDEAGAFWKSAIDHFNKETFSNSVSCEFHLKENINKHAKNFCNDEDKLAFKKICFQWLEVGTEAGTEADYQTTKGIPKNLISRSEAKKDLTYFVNWWYSRRIHWSCAYK